MNLEPTNVSPPIQSVSALTQALKAWMEPQFVQVLVEGEISNFRPSSSKHLYFTLKDADASLSCVLFSYAKNVLPMEDGMHIVAYGRISLYPPRGSYQLVVHKVEPRGWGALQRAFELLKAKLLKEGLFERKKPLPRFIRTIGIVSSETGAALQDILKILQSRAPHLRVILAPALVQGEKSPASLIEALERLEQHPEVELIFLARGGGSLEDLWAFNDEALIRKIASLKKPTLSGVGHETDTTLCDYVVDLRAPTPSAGAEMLSSPWVLVKEELKSLQYKLQKIYIHYLERLRLALETLKARIPHPKDFLEYQSLKVDELQQKLILLMRRKLDFLNKDLQAYVAKIETLSPTKVLARGFCLIQDHGTIVHEVKDLVLNQNYELLMKDGSVKIKIVELL